MSLQTVLVHCDLTINHPHEVCMLHIKMLIHHSLKPATTSCLHLAGDNGLTGILSGRLKSIKSFFSLDSGFISHMTFLLTAVSNSNILAI